MKRLLNFVLILSVLTSCIIVSPSIVNAEASGICGENITWRINNGELLLSGFGDMYENHGYIWQYDDEIRNSITSIIIEDGITSISSSAFFRCSMLETVHIPDSINKIGTGAFAQCINLSDISLPYNLNYIGRGAFTNTAYMNNDANWNEDLLCIDSYLIKARQKNDTTYYVPENITCIADNAYDDCNNMSKLCISQNVRQIGNFNYSYNNKLSYFDVDLNNMFFSSISGVLFNKSQTKLIRYPIMKSDKTYYLIPEGVVEICNGAFASNSYIKQVEIPSSVKTIGSSAFSYCKNLETVNIPFGVTSIESSTFNECNKLKNITLPENLETISDYAFWGCGFSSINIPNNVSTLGSCAFYNCTNLISIIIPEKVSYIDYYVFKGCTNLENVTIKGENTTIGYGTFDGCKLRTLEMSIKQASKLVRSQYNNWAPVIEKIIFTSGDAISDKEFSECPMLKEIKLHNGVSTIGSKAFNNCPNLSVINIPDSVKSIGANAFYNTGYYNDISNWENNVLYKDKCLLNVKPEISGSCFIKSSVRLIASSAFANCRELFSVTIPTEVSEIPEQTFYGCDKLKNIAIPINVKSIGKMAFWGCRNLKIISMPNSVTTIGESAFDYNPNLITYYLGNKSQWDQIALGEYNYGFKYGTIICVLDAPNLGVTDYNKPITEKDNNINFINAIHDWEKEKNDWIDTLVKVVNNIKDDISVSNEEAINNNYEKNKERIDVIIADEGWYQSGSDSARDAAFRAVYDMIADWGEESISLDKVDPSSDVVDFSTRIVKNVINGMKNQTIEKDYGDYTVLITVSGISTGLFENPAFTGSVTVKHKNGKTFGSALINSTVDDTKQVMSDYMLQLKELEENTVEMALETYVSDLISLTDSKLPLDAIKEKLDNASEIINDTLEEKGLGNLNNFIGGVIDVIKSTKEVIELQNGGDTDALIRAIADLDSKLDFLSGESTTATSATLD